MHVYSAVQTEKTASQRPERKTSTTHLSTTTDAGANGTDIPVYDPVHHGNSESKHEIILYIYARTVCECMHVHVCISVYNPPVQGDFDHMYSTMNKQTKTSVKPSQERINNTHPAVTSNGGTAAANSSGYDKLNTYTTES